jgi:SAM-dependent methyltransferase
MINGYAISGNAMSNRNPLVEHFSNAKSYAQLYYGSSPTAHFFQIRLSRVYELLGDFDGYRVLDCGCGPGMMISYLVRRGSEFFGVDLSKEMINECKNRYDDQTNPVRLSVARIEELPFPSCSFDIALCMGVIEYSENAYGAIQELSRVVKENGIVIISMLNKLSPYRLWERYIYKSSWVRLIKKALGIKIPEEPPLSLYTQSDFQNLLISNGLTVSEVVYYDFNLFPAPLDKRFPQLAVFVARKLEFLGRTRLKSLGTGFIVMAKRGMGPASTSVEYNGGNRL